MILKYNIIRPVGTSALGKQICACVCVKCGTVTYNIGQRGERPLRSSCSRYVTPRIFYFSCLDAVLSVPPPTTRVSQRCLLKSVEYRKLNIDSCSFYRRRGIHTCRGSPNIFLVSGHSVILDFFKKYHKMVG